MLAQAQTYNIIPFFTGGIDGALLSAALTIDAARNPYCTSVDNYRYGCSNLFKFAPNPGGSWTESILTT